MEDAGSGKRGRGVRQEGSLNGRYCLDCSVGNSEKSQLSAQKKKRERERERETHRQRGPMVVPDEPVK